MQELAERDSVRRFGRGAAEKRDLPEPPRLRKLIGPGVILVGVGVASGEYILFPYIAAQAGLVFLWAAVVGVAMQFFINMEIERYTLATGETAIGSFQRLWRPWGAILAVGAILATMWPGWATSAATVSTFALGFGDPNLIAIVGLLVIGAILTASPVVYQTVEKLEFIKVAAVLAFIVIALFAAIKAFAFEDTTHIATSFGTFPVEIELAILVGALAAAGAGGANNLVQSNWIRDKGFGMGRYVPRIVSPITGHEEAAPGAERLEFALDEPRHIVDDAQGRGEQAHRADREEERAEPVTHPGVERSGLQGDEVEAALVGQVRIAEDRRVGDQGEDADRQDRHERE